MSVGPTSVEGGRRRSGTWAAVFGDEVLAAAILYRMLHHSHTLVVRGRYRLEQKRKAD